MDTLDADSVKKGQRVGVTLPDQSATPGRFTRINTIIQGAEEENAGADSPQRFSVMITLEDARAVRDIDPAKVEVRFATQTREDVLAVPVGALLALSEGGYAVRSPAGKPVAVETGALRQRAGGGQWQRPRRGDEGGHHLMTPVLAV